MTATEATPTGAPLELKPCPFCGAPGVLEDHENQYTGSTYWMVVCSGSECPADCSAEAKESSAAIAAWNRRAPSPAALGEGIEVKLTKLLDAREQLMPQGLNAYARVSMIETDIARLAPSLLTALTERERLREALTPSAETKAAYIGEFKMRLHRRDECGDEYHEDVTLSWTVIKEIMTAISNRAALSQAQERAGKEKA